MGQPEMTPEQREMAVVLLANALRRDAHLRARAQLVGADSSPLQAGLVKRRAEPSQRYIDGMRDLLRMLFADGYAVAEACLVEARARATNSDASVSQRGNGIRDH